MLPLVGGLVTLPDKTLASAEPPEAWAVPIPPGQVCASRGLGSPAMDCEGSPDREHQGERSSVKLLLCSRRCPFPTLPQTPALMVKGASP